MNEEQMTFSADDLVGILIHNSNQMASHMSVHSTGADWNMLLAHMQRMYVIAQRAQAMLAQAHVHAHQNGAGHDAAPTAAN